MSSINHANCGRARTLARARPDGAIKAARQIPGVRDVEINRLSGGQQVLSSDGATPLLLNNFMLKKPVCKPPTSPQVCLIVSVSMTTLSTALPSRPEATGSALTRFSCSTSNLHVERAAAARRRAAKRQPGLHPIMSPPCLSSSQQPSSLADLLDYSKLIISKLKHIHCPHPHHHDNTGFRKSLEGLTRCFSPLSLFF